ncbi:MAG TPA: hypothetical protein VLN59_11415, partial [Burkholderiales bacterium]|nr:hypothetical protein [Burkholderiales bacterium]
PASFEEAQDELEVAGLTDGLPVVPPSVERVARMLEAARCDSQQVVAILPPLFGPATWHDIAVNAVMAGCRAEYLPVIGAAVAALTDDAFNLLGIATTTGSATPLLIVNGPIVQRIGMNAGANALGNGNRANATIGRALHLIIQNIGGARPGEVDMATLGQPGKFTFCCAENEAGSPWPALHVERGFHADESVVTVVGAAGNVEIVDSESRSARELARTFGASTLIAGSIGGAGLLGGGEPLFIMPPEHALLFHGEGCSKEQAKAMIWEHATLPAGKLSAEVREKLTFRRAMGGAADEDIVRIAERPADVMIVVAGGVGRKAAYVPTWGGTTRAVSKAIAERLS